MKIYRYRFDKDTDYYIKLSLEDYTGKSFSFEIERTTLGKPTVKNFPGLFVGAAHTKDTILVGISDNNFGIDAEFSNREIPNKVIDYAFTKEELLNDKPLDLWVKKEAYVKFMGSTMLNIKNIDITTLKGSFKKFTFPDLIAYVYEE